MANLEKRITIGHEKFDKLVQICVGKKSYYKEITMLKKKNLTKQNVQTVLAVGPRKNSRN